jgi:Protein of unknown function (DUF3592)
MTADIVLILMGITVLLFTVTARNKSLIKQGIKTEGVITDYETLAEKNDTNKYPIVRFTTQKEETYTLPSSDGFLPGRVKKGKKVIIMYNPENPKEFEIQLGNEKLMFITLTGGAIIFIITGLLLLLNQLDIIHIFKK